MMRVVNQWRKKMWVYFVKHKSEVFIQFLNFKTMVEKEKDMNIKCSRSNERKNIFQMNSTRHSNEIFMQLILTTK